MDRELKKSLSDRLYDRRKLAALDLEQVVRTLLAKGDKEKITAIIRELTQDFTYAVRHPNYRNGGLIGLAAVAIALGQVELAQHLDDIVPPVLSCFGDSDSRVRYYACESLYNVAKVAKGEILQFFNEIFDVLGRLVADPEESVRNGADLVDRLLKDIVAEKASIYTFLISRQAPAIVPPVTETDGSTPSFQAAPAQAANSFSLANFIPVLVERVYVNNPSNRMFLVQWIVLLDSIPDLNLVSYLPTFLDGLFQFLSDSNKEVRVATKAALEGFTREIKAVTLLKRERGSSELAGTPKSEGIEAGAGAAPEVQSEGQRTPTQPPDQAESSLADTSTLTTGLYTVGQDTFIDYSRIVSIILDNIDSADEEIRFAALEWLRTFLEVSPQNVLSEVSRIAGILLPTLSAQNAEIREASKEINEIVLRMIPTQDGGLIDQTATVNALTLQFLNEEETARLAALDWLVALQSFNTQGPLNKLALNTLLKLLGDPSDLVVAKDLQLLAQILDVAKAETFKELLSKVLAHFKADRKLLAWRGKYVLSRLCQTLDPERLYETFASIIDGEPDKEFAGIMVQNLNNTLLISPELRGLRDELRKLDGPRGAKLFVALFSSWSWNAIAAFSLCLLAGAYEHAYMVLQTVASSDVSVETLVNIDKLVQLLESPLFASLRLQLLQPEQYPYLYRCLYGLLMVLPQSSAFDTLDRRLQSVARISTLAAPDSTGSARQKHGSIASPSAKQPAESAAKVSSIDWAGLLRSFQKAQNTLAKRAREAAVTTVPASSARATAGPVVVKK